MSTTLSDQIRTILQSFIGDPPDNDFQCGYLSAVLVIATEVIGIGVSDPVWIKASSLLDESTKKRPQLRLVNKEAPE
jgi:hypothetical protein